MGPSPKSGVAALAKPITTEKSKPVLPKMGNLEKDDDLFSYIEKPFGVEEYVKNRIILGGAHLCALYYCYAYFACEEVNRSSILFEFFYGMLGGLGTSVGVHRYWTHRTFKANLPLQIILMILHTLTLHNSIYKWCRDHRLHHKYTDTDADPHNSKRGFWFSHIGWLFLPRTKELTEIMKTFDTPDLRNDPIIRFQAKYYIPLVLVFHQLLPISVYYYLFEMPLLYSFLANLRGYILMSHVTFCVNSVAHLWGDKPYDKNRSSVDNKIVALFTGGGGWHNYHHTFPRDYRSSAFGWKLNYATAFIDFFAWIGWAWDLKTVPQSAIHDRMEKTGDGSLVPPKRAKKSAMNDYMEAVKYS